MDASLSYYCVRVRACACVCTCPHMFVWVGDGARLLAVLGGGKSQTDL